MNYHLAEQIANERLTEARAMAAQASLLRDMHYRPDPLRVTVGLGLIRLGRWMAGQAAKQHTGPRRATV
ncbi:MAG TPA: hypothetical protein VEL05_03375 [Candidatus Acidoferrum sp.]|nr:hypothetical protein [Candidatus Acidoferrum sp.]